MHLLETTAYEVRHPEMVMVGRSTVVLTTIGKDGPFVFAERQLVISLLHITKLEPLAASGAFLANGE